MNGRLRRSLRGRREGWRVAVRDLPPSAESDGVLDEHKMR
jgi:hypothetical protein